MRSKGFFLALIGVAVCAVPPAARAQFHRGPLGPGGGLMPMMMLLRHANLSPAQDQQVHQLMEGSFAQARPLMKQLRALHEQMADKLLAPGKVSAADFSAMQAQENNLRNQLDAQILATALKIRDVLTPAQLAKLADLHTKLKALHAQAETLLGDDDVPPGPPS
jgi:Spy/CpxP family protein refolding chaperone